jgi:alpha-L-fucosidase 2
MATKLNAAERATRKLELEGPITRWDEALPLGNGLMGALVWGEAGVLRFSMDRGDLWDERPIEGFETPGFTWKNLVGLVREGKHGEVFEQFEKPYWSPYPTKIPGGRIEVDLAKGAVPGVFTLDMERAEAAVSVGKKGVKTFVDAAGKVGMAVFEKGVLDAVRLVPARFGGEAKVERGISNGELARLGYASPVLGQEGDVQWAHQVGAMGFEYALVVGTKALGDGRVLMAFTVACTNDGVDAVAIGKGWVQGALKAGYEKTMKGHLAYWKAFWGKSSVSVPDAEIERHYNLVRYFYGASSRRGAPPIPLQGVWTADEGTLPPWKGDYHHDLNTQLTYWAYLNAGHLEEGLCFLDYLWDLLPEMKKFTKRFFQSEGASVPSVASLKGYPLGGWPQYSFIPTNTVWLAQSFFTHWEYTQDKAFLKSRAYPWCVEVAKCLESVMEETAEGKLRLHLSSSPEINDNNPDSWMKPNSNFDQALLLWFYGAMGEMADALGKKVEAAKWRGVLAKLEPLVVSPEGWWGKCLMVDRELPLKGSHRHHSHLMALHPLGVMSVEGSDEDRKTIAQSMLQVDWLGTGMWTGYSFSWMSCMSARVGMPERALGMLENYLKAFVSRNGFHLNGDFKNQGLSYFKYRPFTLEGNFAAMHAVHEMFLQGQGGVVRVFPAVSGRWKDCAFTDWLTQGAWKVSASRRGGKTASVEVVAGVSGVLRLRNPFGAGGGKWNVKVKHEGADVVVRLKKGEKVRGRLGRGAQLV